MSLFAVISAVATSGADPADDELFDDAADDRRGRASSSLLPRRLRSAVKCTGGCDGRRSRVARRSRSFARRTRGIARELARRTGLTHAEVNAELNRRSGLRRVSEATLAQLDERLAVAEKWFLAA